MPHISSELIKEFKQFVDEAIPNEGVPALENLPNGGIPCQLSLQDAAPVVTGGRQLVTILPAGMALQDKHMNLIKERMEEVIKANRCIEKVIDLGMKLPGLSTYPRLQLALNHVVESQEKAETVLNEARFSAKFQKDYGPREVLTAEGATVIATKLKDALHDLSAHGMLVKHDMKQIQG